MENDMNELAVRYLPIIKAAGCSGIDERLLMERSGPLDIFYAPFDYLNRDAKIVIIGITPGLQQMTNAIRAARTELFVNAGAKFPRSAGAIFPTY